jgi:N utilization substance protein A
VGFSHFFIFLRGLRMIVIENFNQVTAQIETERGISKDILVQAVEQALVSACRKKFSDEAILQAKVDPDTGEARIYQTKTVVKKVEDEILQITVADAKEYNPKAAIDEEVVIEVTPDDFGRVAAQAAKQVIIQRIREAEKNAIFKDFKDKVGHVIIGTVQRVENQNYLINLGRAEAILSYKDQIPGERFSPKEKVRVYVSSLDRQAKGSFIQISRTHPGLLRELMIQEIPEIQDGIIEIVSVSRDPGKRAKVAVKSNNPSIGAVGTCVGHMGTRIQSVTKELGREKIDILEWHEDPRVFIGNALKPAKISHIIVTNEKERTAVVVVPNDQLSLAIGKGGINVRLSVRLTGWKLDVINDEDYQKRPELKPQAQLSMVEKIRLENEKNKQAKKSSEAAPVNAHDIVIDDPVDEPKTKLSDLAKMMGVTTKDLFEKAQALGLALKSTRSTLDPEQVQTIKESLS